MDRAALIRIATTHESETVRRSACHLLFSIGCFSGALSAADQLAKERARELAAADVAGAAIAKAAGVKP